MSDTKFDLNDILITPATTSRISSRKDVNIFSEYEDYLPIMSAPMDTVAFDEDSVKRINDYNIIPTIPRTSNHMKLVGVGHNIKKYSSNIGGFSRPPVLFISISLKQLEWINENQTFQDFVYFRFSKRNPLYLLIDIANGHMRKLHHEVIKLRKNLASSVKIMIGNIANPETYKAINENLRVDFVRLSIGTGSACLTSEQTAIGYPMGSLIHECYKLSLEMNNPPKIVADGGFKSYSDIIKGIALGADFVMIGSLLNKSFDISEKEIYWKDINIKNRKLTEWMYQHNFQLQRKYRGMSTKEVQKRWGKLKLTTSEGIVKYNDIEYTLGGWVSNFTDYLRSAMSYAGANTISEFKGVDFNIITENAYRRFNK